MKYVIIVDHHFICRVVIEEVVRRVIDDVPVISIRAANSVLAISTCTVSVTESKVQGVTWRGYVSSWPVIEVIVRLNLNAATWIALKATQRQPSIQSILSVCVCLIVVPDLVVGDIGTVGMILNLLEVEDIVRIVSFLISLILPSKELDVLPITLGWVQGMIVCIRFNQRIAAHKIRAVGYPLVMCELPLVM